MAAQSLKVLISDPHLKGGGQVRYLANLSRQLVLLGHAVTVACKPGSILVERASEAGAACRDTFFFRSGLHPRAWANDLAQARRFITTEHPDVIHVSGSQDHWVWALANRFLGRRTCLVRTRHNTYPVSDHLPNRILNRAWTDYQIVVCDVVRQDLARLKAFDAARMRSIHNGVDAELFRPDTDARVKARRAFGYSDEHIVCGIAARLVPAKGHEFLFKAIAQLEPTLPHLRVLVLGEGRLDAELRELTQDLGIAPMVTFAGFRCDMAYCTQAFDIGVQPSIDCDTSSFSLKEQMAAEKPVVASDYGGLKEIVNDGEEGFVVPTATVEPLADAIAQLARDPGLRGRMGCAGRERVLREFTVQVFATRTVEAYRCAIEVHRERLAHR